MLKSKKIIDRIQKKMAGLTIRSLSKTIEKNVQNNFIYLNSGFSIKYLQNENFGKKKIAIIISAGPSLKRVDQTKILKKYKNKAIIIACDGSLYYLLRNNIIPDLVVTLDPDPTRIIRWFGVENLSLKTLKKDDYFRRQDLDTDFKKEISVNNKILKLTKKFGEKLNVAVCTSSSSAVVKRLIKIKSKIYWWNPFIDNPNKKNSISRKIFIKNKLPLINAGGNVGSAAWMIADCVLNVKKIALLGMDLGYYPNTKIENTQYFDILEKNFKKENLNNFFKKIYNPLLKKYYYTDYAYFWYKQCFREMLSIANSDTYNCTGGGILFEKPLKLITLKAFCNRYLK